MGVEPTITLTEDDGGWVARDTETSVVSQGRTRTEALENLDEAVALSRGNVGRAPTDEELEELGVGPDANETGADEQPDVLK